VGTTLAMCGHCLVLRPDCPHFSIRAMLSLFPDVDRIDQPPVLQNVVQGRGLVYGWKT